MKSLDRIWEEISKNDFTDVGDDELGLDRDARRHIVETYFNERVLEGDHPAVHQDRDRARDVIRYRWRGDSLTLSEHDEIEIRNRSGFAGPRTHARVTLLSDPQMTACCWSGRSTRGCSIFISGRARRHFGRGRLEI